MTLKLEQHENILKNSTLRQLLLKKFIPSFYYHKDEQNFPVDPDQAIKNIIEVKRDEYLHIQERQGRALTETEAAELDAIDTYFWNHDTNTFNYNYKQYQNNPLFISLSKKPSQLFIFDEKHYGYQLGEKIDVLGTAPFGHQKYKANKKSAPVTSSIIPTEDGFFIQYEYLYALSHAIYGAQWLRRILPEWLCKKVEDFGFHYGDSEGVGIHIKLENGMATIDAIQTWAHGRDYAELVKAKDCHFDADGNICVYVGLGTHPSYAFNFVGRNLPMDLVGNTYKIRAEEVIDVSPDVMEASFDFANIDNLSDLQEFTRTNPLAHLAQELPSSLSSIRRFADSNPLAFNSIKNEAHLKTNFLKFNTYHPWLFLAKIRDIILSWFNKKEIKMVPITFILPPLTSMLELSAQDTFTSFKTALSSSSLGSAGFFSAHEEEDELLELEEDEKLLIDNALEPIENTHASTLEALSFFALHHHQNALACMNTTTIEGPSF